MAASSLPVMAMAFAGAVVTLYPALHKPPLVLILTIGAIWLVALLNLRGGGRDG